jgi:hypothetical protein
MIFTLSFPTSMPLNTNIYLYLPNNTDTIKVAQSNLFVKKGYVYLLRQGLDLKKEENA